MRDRNGVRSVPIRPRRSPRQSGNQPQHWLGPIAIALTTASLVAALAPLVATAAANELSDGSVTPTTGTHLTVFVFRVTYASSQGFPATSVFANVGNTTVPMALESGSETDGTYEGASTLPAGSWPVVFEADAAQGTDPVLAGPTVTVIGPSPPPTPTPAPTPRQTPRPTVAPIPPATPRPTSPVFGPLETLPEATAAASSSPETGSPAPSPSPDSETPQPTRSPAATASGTPSGTPAASASAADEQEPNGSGRGAWLLLGGGLAATGAAMLCAQWIRWRRRQLMR
jgi:hypothetical protein